MAHPSPNCHFKTRNRTTPIFQSRGQISHHPYLSTPLDHLAKYVVNQITRHLTVIIEWITLTKVGILQPNWLLWLLKATLYL